MKEQRRYPRIRFNACHCIHFGQPGRLDVGDLKKPSRVAPRIFVGLPPTIRENVARELSGCDAPWPDRPAFVPAPVGCDLDAGHVKTEIVPMSLLFDAHGCGEWDVPEF